MANQQYLQLALFRAASTIFHYRWRDEAKYEAQMRWNIEYPYTFQLDPGLPQDRRVLVINKS